MANYVLVAIYGIALAFGLTRVGIVFAPGLIPEGHALKSFEAFAHLFTGFLLGGFAFTFDSRSLSDPYHRAELPWKCLWIAAALSAVELACFVLDLFV